MPLILMTNHIILFQLPLQASEWAKYWMLLSISNPSLINQITQMEPNGTQMLEYCRQPDIKQWKYKNTKWNSNW